MVIDLQVVLLQVPSALPNTVTDPAAGGPQVMVEPVPMEVLPPQEPLYHFHAAPVPKVPPLMLKLVDVPTQILTFVAFTLSTGTEVSRTVMVTLLQLVLLQVPSALT